MGKGQWFDQRLVHKNNPQSSWKINSSQAHVSHLGLRPYANGLDEWLPLSPNDKETGLVAIGLIHSESQVLDQESPFLKMSPLLVPNLPSLGVLRAGEPEVGSLLVASAMAAEMSPCPRITAHPVPVLGGGGVQLFWFLGHTQ